MNNDKTLIVILLDRSGSMQDIKNDMNGAYASFIEKQRKEPGECNVSLYQFDTHWEQRFSNKPLNEKVVSDLDLSPRGSTALYDSVVKTIDLVGKELNDLKEQDRPTRVIFVTITDGEENASREFNATAVKERVEHQTSKYNWKFIFIGADQDAILTGGSIGIKATSSLLFNKSANGVQNTFDILHNATKHYRSLCKEDYDAVTCDWMASEQDRSAAVAN